MIVHVDMDAFYASVEERERPELAGKPLIVGGASNGRGVVCAANYAAREFGVHSAMPTAKAIRLCPEATILQPRMKFYAEISTQIREIFHRYTPVVEPLSLDEAFLDVNDSVTRSETVEDIGRRIKADIQAELNLIASVGVAPNKFLAKLASDLDKPDGFTVIPLESVQRILDPLPVKKIWGVGRVTQKRMAELGIHTIADLRVREKGDLRHVFGSHGERYQDLARGIDDRPVQPHREVKSVSRETTFATDVTSMEELLASLLELTEQVAARLRAKQITARTVQLKLRYHDFTTITRSRSLQRPTDETDRLWTAARELLTAQLPDRPLRVRLIGMGVTNLQRDAASQTGKRQLELFDT